MNYTKYYCNIDRETRNVLLLIFIVAILCEIGLHIKTVNHQPSTSIHNSPHSLCYCK